jgi:N-acetylmuramoyl-L-alanine amidase
MSASRPLTAKELAAEKARRVRRRRRRRSLTVLVVAAAVVVTATVWESHPLGSGSASAGVQLDPSAFSPTACMAFPPTSGDRHATVFLDAGHGGLDPGAVGTTSSGTTIDEGTETLPVELDAATLLRADGYRVVVSRTTDSNVVRLTSADLSDGVLSLQGAHDDVAARDVCANLADASVLVGIYFDSGGSPSDAGSVTTYDTARPFSAANLRLATLVQKDVLAAMNARGWQIPDDGVQPDSQEGSLVQTSSDSSLAEAAASYGHVLLLGPADPGFFATPSTMPGALIEPLFVTDPFEGTLAATPSDQEVIATGVARAIEQYLAPARAG